MKMTLDNLVGLNTISAYENGQCKIRGRLYSPSLVVFSDRLITDWPVLDLDHLRSQDFAPIVDAAPAVVLLGTGERQRFPDPQILLPLMDAQIGYEVMHNRAACQTFNILLAEGRRAALVLLGG
jgi:uncharacterized protein